MDKLPRAVTLEIIAIIKKLAETPRPRGYIKLTNRPGYRIRKGNYRIIYDIYDKLLLIEVISVGNRKDIYD